MIFVLSEWQNYNIPKVYYLLSKYTQFLELSYETLSLGIILGDSILFVSFSCFKRSCFVREDHPSKSPKRFISSTRCKSYIGSRLAHVKYHHGLRLACVNSHPCSRSTCVKSQLNLEDSQYKTQSWFR